MRAAFLPTGPKPNDQTEFITIPLPEVISLSALETALACPCRFYLNVLLGLEELPDIEPGLSPLERGSVMHSVLQTFTGRFLEVLQDTGVWDDAVARQHLQAVVAEYMSRGQENPHWEAEMARWLEGEEALLRQWLGQEKQRFLEGWRWLAMENAFTGLQLPGWPTRVRGRLDRVDTHQTQGLMLWDYKTGAVPGQKEIREDRSQFQLSGLSPGSAAGSDRGAAAPGGPGRHYRLEIQPRGSSEIRGFQAQCRRLAGDPGRQIDGGSQAGGQGRGGGFSP